MNSGASVASPPQSHPLRTLAVVVVLIAGLAGLDRFLARTERDEVQGAARRSWQTGMRLLREGRAPEALNALRNAHTLVLDNPGYELDMILALMALGRTADADPLIDEVLQRAPNDGAANLTAARLMAKERRTTDATAYYHRAIYGEWPGNALSQRLDARFELVEYLVRQRSNQQLLAELISLEAEPDQDESRQRRIAQLFLVAGSPNRAAGVYQALITRDPDDAGAYEGLGEAKMEQGDFHGARSAFLQASQRQPDAYIAQRLDLLSDVIGIDPTPRRLPVTEKYRRSVQILEMAKDDLEGHLAQLRTAATDETDRLLTAAATAVAAPEPREVNNELSEQNLDLAVKIWKIRESIFGVSVAPQEEELRLIMGRLAQ